MIAYGWASAETLHDGSLLRRRQKIGLAEPCARRFERAGPDARSA